MTSLAAWLYANVLGNLIASIIWGLPAGAAFIWHHRGVHSRLNTIHQHIEGIHDRLDGRDSAYQHHLRRLAGHILDSETG